MMKNVYSDKNCKSRYFTFKVYEDNLINLRLSVQDLVTDLLACGGGFISPLHEFDDCKPHYHVISISENARNCFFLHDLLDKYNCERFIGKVNSSSKDTFLLYLTHQNDGNHKHTYFATDVISVGVKYEDWLQDKDESDLDCLDAIMYFQSLEEIISLRGLLNCLKQNHRFDCIQFVLKHSYLIIQLLKEGF